jgi:hypothetical protein
VLPLRTGSAPAPSLGRPSAVAKIIAKIVATAGTLQCREGPYGTVGRQAVGPGIWSALVLRSQPDHRSLSVQ